MNSPTEDLIQQAIHSARAGDKRKSQGLLAQVVRQEPQNARAWYLLSQVVETDERAAQCLKRVLELEPGNAQAQERLDYIRARHPSPTQKKTSPWLWIVLGGGGLFSLICLCILVFALAGATITPTQIVALPLMTQAPVQQSIFSMPPTWTPTFTLEPSATFESTVTSTSLPILEPSATTSTVPLAPILVSTSAPNPPTSGNTMRVYFFDVGQGDSALIQTPGGQNVLIDGGEQDTGIVQYLQALNVQRIDLMIATHPHSDHIGGLVQVLKAFPVSRVVTNGQMGNTPIYEQFTNEVAAEQAVYGDAKRGDTIPAGGINIQVLSPVSTSDPDMNENSLVLRFSYGNTTFLMMGDAGKSAESSLIASSQTLKADILKVGHHGSASGSSPAFLNMVKPAVAIYFAGVDNQFNLPAPETIAALTSVGAKVYSTDINGTIIVMAKPGGYTIHTGKIETRTPPTVALPTNPPIAPVINGLQIVTVSNPVSPGEQASLAAKTVPGASCTITVYTKSGPSQAEGLGPKNADSSGTVSWTWKVGTRTTSGTWRIVVTATINGQTYTQETPFVVR